MLPHVDLDCTTTEMVEKATVIAEREGLAKPGERLVITAGMPFGTPARPTCCVSRQSASKAGTRRTVDAASSTEKDLGVTYCRDAGWASVESCITVASGK